MKLEFFEPMFFQFIRISDKALSFDIVDQLTELRMLLVKATEVFIRGEQMRSQIILRVVLHQIFSL